MIEEVGNRTQAILVSEENLDFCAEFAKGGEMDVKNRHGAVNIMTRISAFRIHPGEWLLKRGNCVFKLTEHEFDHLYRGKIYE